MNNDAAADCANQRQSHVFLGIIWIALFTVVAGGIGVRQDDGVHAFEQFIQFAQERDYQDGNDQTSAGLDLGNPAIEKLVRGIHHEHAEQEMHEPVVMIALQVECIGDAGAEDVARPDVVRHFAVGVARAEQMQQHVQEQQRRRCIGNRPRAIEHNHQCHKRERERVFDDKVEHMRRADGGDSQQNPQHDQQPRTVWQSPAHTRMIPANLLRDQILQLRATAPRGQQFQQIENIDDIKRFGNGGAGVVCIPV